MPLRRAQSIPLCFNSEPSRLRRVLLPILTATVKPTHLCGDLSSALGGASL